MRGVSTTRIDVGAVLEAGRQLTIRQDVALPDFDTYRFPEPARVALEARRIGRGIDLSGTVDARAEGMCSRCLAEAAIPVHLEIEENLNPESDETDPLSENNVLDGTQLDLGDLVRQLIDSALPIAFLCSEDCRGLCERCGLNRDGLCRCSPPVETSWPI